MFIHWGLYTLPARHEWVKNREKMTDEHYERYFKHFDPDLYDPKTWARYAKQAGMRYAVITTKHHEGFCLWELIRLVRELQSGILVNNRLDLDDEADFYTPEQFQPRGWVTSQGKRVTWEACQTLNGSWGYDRDNLDWKSPDLLVRMLIDSVSKGGNLLLNVGPTGRGEFDPRAVATLQVLGEWTRVHGRSIYGASASEYEAPTDCRLTQRGKRLYLHVFSWPMQRIFLEGLAGKVEYVQFLHDASEIIYQEGSVKDAPYTTDTDSGGSDTLTLELPIQRPDLLVPVIEIFLKDE